MTKEERWKEIEECFKSIELDVKSRCYVEHSTTGIRYMVLLVRKHLGRIDELLLELSKEQ